MRQDQWDRSSAWLERLPVKEEVGGSSPLGPALQTAHLHLPGTEEQATCGNHSSKNSIQPILLFLSS
jgi:hypothetical protein